MLSASHTSQLNRYKIFLEANALILIGYIMVSAETFIARAIGLISISYSNIFIISIAVISGSICSILILSYRKTINPALEKTIFISLLVLYLILYSIWIYLLKDFRIFALFSSILAITIILSYASLFQSLMFSIGTIISYTLTTYFSISIAGQEGNFIKELFFALCFIPTSIIFSIVADQINKKNNELEKTKLYLEETNNQLIILNRELEHTQKTTDIEMELAYEIQKSLFPEPPRNTDVWDIALSFKPRYGLSGDFYDFYYDSGRLTGLSLFDVSGHGLPSALVTILAKPVFYRYFNLFRNEQLGRVIEVSNNTLRHDLSEINMYITGIVLRFKDNEVDYVNAGHPDLLYKSRDSGIVRIISDKDANYKAGPVGVIETVSSCRSLKLSPVAGDILFLYTDCLTESNNIEKSRYGSERLMQSLEEAPDGTAHDILNFLIGRFHNFMNEKEMDDDFTAILAKKTG